MLFRSHFRGQGFHDVFRLLNRNKSKFIYHLGGSGVGDMGGRPSTMDGHLKYDVTHIQISPNNGPKSSFMAYNFK